jgi:hypothetical protein
MVNGGAISPFIRRQIFLGTDWSRVQEIKNEIQRIRTELIRAGKVGTIEDALRDNKYVLDELDRKLDQLIYLQRTALALGEDDPAEDDGSGDPSGEESGKEEHNGDNEDL